MTFGWESASLDNFQYKKIFLIRVNSPQLKSTVARYLKWVVGCCCVFVSDVVHALWKMFHFQMLKNINLTKKHNNKCNYRLSENIQIDIILAVNEKKSAFLEKFLSMKKLIQIWNWFLVKVISIIKCHADRKMDFLKLMKNFQWYRKW